MHNLQDNERDNAQNSQNSAAAKPNKHKKLKRRTKRRSHIVDLIKLAAFSVLLVYSVGTIISTQADIAEQKAAVEKLQDEIAETKTENDEYQRLLGSDILNGEAEYGENEEDYMLSAAIERGYAYPREIRFYPKNHVE